MTRGLSLNNPLNLETNSKISWLGEIKPTTDPGRVLCQFDAMDHGLRAGLKDLANQQILHGLNTWNDIITKYAPPVENDTIAYIKAMVAATGYGPNQILDLSDPVFLALAGKSVIIHEQGFNPCSDAQLAQASDQALNQT